MPARPKDKSADYFQYPGTYKPPAALPRAARALWRGVMDSTPEDQWRPGDLPLLAMFCRVSVLASEAVAHLEQDGQVEAGGKVSPWVKVSSDHGKTLATLAEVVPGFRTRL